jgi:hypothetical protein
MNLFSKIAVILTLLITAPVYADDDSSIIDKAKRFIAKEWHAVKEALGFMEGPQGAAALYKITSEGNEALMARFDTPKVPEPPLSDEQFNNVLIGGGQQPETASPQPVVDETVKKAIQKQDAIEELKTGENAFKEIIDEAEPQLP